MLVQVTLPNGVSILGSNLHDVLKEMHTVAIAVGTDDDSAVPPKGSGVLSYLSWLSSRIYRRARVDLSIQDEHRFVVNAVKHGWLREVRYTSDENSIQNDYDLWRVDAETVADFNASVDDAGTGVPPIQEGTTVHVSGAQP